MSNLIKIGTQLYCNGEQVKYFHGSIKDVEKITKEVSLPHIMDNMKEVKDPSEETKFSSLNSNIQINIHGEVIRGKQSDEFTKL